MHSRLGELGFQSIDREGDCFFRFVSYQLYGNSNHHMCIRTAGFQFMRDNPERFIESNTKNSWLRYLNNMSIQGVSSHFAYESFRLLSVRLHLESICLRGICQFAYVLNSVLLLCYKIPKTPTKRHSRYEINQSL